MCLNKTNPMEINKCRNLNSNGDECGSEGELRIDFGECGIYDLYWVECPACGDKGIESFDKHTAVRNWN